MIKIWLNIIRNLFSIFGILVFVSIILFLFFGETSKQRRNIFFETVKSFVGIGFKYDGFIANTPYKYFDYMYLTLTNKFINHDFSSINLEINLKNLKLLEKMRDDKYRNVNNKSEWARAQLRIEDKKNNVNKIVKVKLRPKGDRAIHFLNLDSMSYKLDVRGEDDYIFGMEEMSLQKPIVRNFAWEILYHQMLRDESILSLQITPVKFYRNGEYLGVFVLEEGFGKELLEKQARKNGPIVSIDENLDQSFPNLTYEYYSENYWVKKSPDIINYFKNNLEFIKTNFRNDEFQIENYFDIDKWAKFFALSDVLKMFHGTVTKSVKLYYNPSSGLIEPIAFDGHYQSGYNDFSFIDFIDNPKIECGYACTNRVWYSLFFDKKNINFLKKYFYHINRYTSDDYQNKLINYSENQLKKINNFFYSEYQSSDRVFFNGILPYYYDNSVIKKRNSILKNKILKKNLNSSLEQIEFARNFFYKNIRNLEISENRNIEVKSGLWVLKDVRLIDRDITFKDDSILILTGNNQIIGQNKEVNISGDGMLVQLNGKIDLENIKFRQLKNIRLDGLNWSGALNIIDSITNIKNVSIENTLGEDSINLVGCKSYIEDLTVLNSESDSVDIDFGKITFNTINCNGSGNDCFDTSGSTVSGNILSGSNVVDKLGSFGENSNVSIKKINGNDINIGIASKDGSSVQIKELNLTNYNIPLASYYKKFFFKDSKIEIQKINLKEAISNNFLVSDGNKLVINKKEHKIKSPNKVIINSIYPNT